MDFNFNPSDIWRKLNEREHNLIYHGHTEPMYDSQGRPVDEARQPPGYSPLEIWGRVKRVRKAIEDSHPLTLKMMQEDFADLSPDMIWPMLGSILQDVALYVGGGAVIGGAIGGAVGSLAFGVGAIPGAGVGGTLGGEAGFFILQIIGVKELIEAIAKLLPEVTKLYVSGVQHAWGQMPQGGSANSGSPIDPFYSPNFAAQEIARGNKMLVYALLAAMVAYIMRSGGSAQKLAGEMTKNSRLGKGMAEWLVANEKKLLAHPKLQEMPNSGPTKKMGGDAGASAAAPKSGAAGNGTGATGKSGGANSGKGGNSSGGGKGGADSGKGSSAEPAPKEPAKGDAKKPCACAATPLPVDAIFGCKFLAGELDFALPAALPFPWQRSYSSDNPTVGLLGQGWSVPISLALEFSAHAVTVLDGLHRGISFPHLQVGESFYSRYEQVTLSRIDELVFEYTDKDFIINRFATKHPSERIAKLISKTDRNGNQIRIEYDEQSVPALPSRIIDSAGRVLALEINAAKRLTAVKELRTVDGVEQSITLVCYAYDDAGDLIEVRNRANEITREFAYQQHILVQHAVPGGLVSNYEYSEYSPKGQVTKNTTNTGQSWRLAYGKHQSQVSDNLGRNIRHRFDDKKRYLGTVNALGGFTKRELDTYGNLIALTDPSGSTERYVYDERSRLIKIEAADGAITRIDYAGSSEKAARIIDALGAATKMRYDEQHNLLAVTDALGQVTQYEYDARGLPTKIIDARGGSKQLAYNHAGQLTSYTDCSAQTTRFEYDFDGNLTRTVDPLGAETNYRYDAAMRLQSAHFADGSSEHYEYDAQGRLVGHVDALGQRTTYALDAEGRLIKRSNALGGVLEYGYDDAKRLAQLVNENGAVYTFSYDALDRLVQETGFDSRTTRYQHDAAGRPIAKTEYGIGEPPTLRRASGEIAEGGTEQAHHINTSYQRDKAGRLIEKSVKRADQLESQALRKQYAYDALGRLTQATNQSAKVSLAYDALGQLQEERSETINKVGATEAGHNTVLRHNYDALGNRIQTILPDGRTLNHLYYGSGHLHQINLDGEVISDIERDNAHREISRSQGALQSQFSYDPVGRLRQQLALLDPGYRAGTGGLNPANAGSNAASNELANIGSLQAQRSALQALDNNDAAQPVPIGNNPGKAIIARDYAYDAAGNLLSITDQRHGKTSYRYDVIGRILSAISPQSQEHFAFDPAHNLLNPDGLGQTPNSATNDGKANRLRNNQLEVYGDQRFSYDEHGNLRDKKIARHTQIQLTWNAEHQLITSQTCRNAAHDQPTVQSTEYSYDPFGRRIAKHDAFGTTHFVWDGNRLLSETRASHSRTYFYAGNSFVPLAQIDSAPTSEQAQTNAQILYFHTDHLGTPRELTDSEGGVQWSATYKAWGNTLVAEQQQAVPQTGALEQLQALRFQGQYFDVETGLHYNRFRYYDPAIGRFISQDPIGLAGGNNLYQYAPNPSGWIDPLGLEWVDPSTINFSQAYVTGQTATYEQAMRNGEWDWNRYPLGHPNSSALTVAEVNGQLVSFDNRRLLAAQNAGLSEVLVNKVNLSDIKPGTTITWQKSLDKRLNSAPKGGAYPKIQLPANGSPNKPKVCPC